MTDFPDNRRVRMSDFIAGLPKAELHVHHVGSASPRDRLRARRRATRARCRATPTSCADFFEFRDFAHFIEVYLAVVDLIRTPEDVRYLTYEVAREMAERPAGAVRRAHLHAVHLGAAARGRGMPIEAYTEAIEDARVAAERDFGIVLRWIYDIPGESGAAGRRRDPRRTRSTTAPTRLVGFGLGGPEIGVPRPQFQPHFDAARARRAAQRAARRRDHRPGDGLGRAARCSAPSGSATARRPAQDPDAARRTSPSTGIPLEVCPSSNIATRAVATPRRAPDPGLRDAGVTVTINSDDPPMFGTTLNQEYEIAADLLDLDEAGRRRPGPRRRCARRSPPDDVKTRILAEIDAYVHGAGS